MNMRERVARAIQKQERRVVSQDGDAWDIALSGFERAPYLAMADAVLDVLMEPDEGMLASVVTMTDLTDPHFDKAAAVLEGMPPLSPARQQEGLRAVADLYRDWQAMLTAARNPRHLYPCDMYAITSERELHRPEDRLRI